MEEPAMRRFVSALGIVSLLLALSAAPVGAAAGGIGHTVTITQHQHGVFTEPNAVNPCNGHTITLTVDGNAVQHITFFPGSDEVWMTFTETGKFTGTDGDVTYTGHFTIWANFNMNERNSNSTFTFSVKASGSDGSVIIGHQTAHFTMNANGTVTVSFDKMSFTCG
jgi:hypothetical protein